MINCHIQVVHMNLDCSMFFSSASTAMNYQSLNLENVSELNLFR